MIIHISGAPGYGKTTFGVKINEIKNKNVKVFDLDDIFDNFMYESNYRFNSNKYQKYVNNLISKNKNKHIIFVGLNMDKGHTNKLYNLSATHKFYIDIKINLLLERLFYREVQQIYTHRKNIWQDYLRDPNTTSLKLMHNININQLKNETKKFDKIYIKKGYHVLSTKLIKKFLKQNELIK